MAKKTEGYLRGSRGDELKIKQRPDPIRGPQKAEFFTIGDKSQDISGKLEAEQKRMANPSGRK